jgi:hypothetical protein
MDKRVLITLSDIQALRPTAELDGVRWEPFCRESQDLDLRPILGDSLFYDFMTKFYQTGDPSYAIYQTLLNGTNYTYSGQDIYYDGFKPFVVYSTLARFVQNNPVNITRFGVVTKVVNQSQPVDPQVLRQVTNEYKSNAKSYENQIRQYLDNNQTTYTMYKGADVARNNSFRILNGSYNKSFY